MIVEENVNSTEFRQSENIKTSINARSLIRSVEQISIVNRNTNTEKQESPPQQNFPEPQPDVIIHQSSDMVNMSSEEAPRMKTHSDDLDEEEMGNSGIRMQLDPEIVGPD